MFSFAYNYRFYLQNRDSTHCSALMLWLLHNFLCWLCSNLASFPSSCCLLIQKYLKSVVQFKKPPWAHRGETTIRPFTIDTEWFYKFCDFKKHCKRAVKELGCSSCKFGLLSAALESVLKVVNSAAAAVQNISESRSALQYACREASKRERMFIIGYRIALVSLKKVFANQYSW